MQYFIGYRMFAALDSRATDEQERHRESALRLEFIKLVPAAGRLRATELILQRHHTEQGCRLEYHLAFIPQTSFDFDSNGEVPVAGVREAANFEADVASVTADCVSVKTRLVLAHSPALGHHELGQNTPAMLDAKALRTLFRRRARQVVLPTPEGALLLDVPPVPKYLPTAIKCELIARVTRLSPGRTAILRNLAWRSTQQTPTEQLPPLPDTVSACRKALSRDDVMRLLNGMDEGEVVAFDAQVAFDWATGGTTHVKLLTVAAD